MEDKSGEKVLNSEPPVLTSPSVVENFDKSHVVTDPTVFVTTPPPKKKISLVIILILVFVLVLLLSLVGLNYFFGNSQKTKSQPVGKIPLITLRPSATPAPIEVGEEIFKDQEPSLASIAPITGNLKKGETVTLKVDIDQGVETLFYLTTTGGEVDFSLVSPSGQEITPDYAKNSDKGVQYEVSEGSPETPRYWAYNITLPEKGSWQVKIVGNEDAFYKVSAFLKVGMALQATFDKVIYKVGEKAVIAARLQGAGSLTNLNITANVQLPNEHIDKIQLVSNKNGIFTGTYVIPQVSGYVTADVVASGLHDNFAFTRGDVLLTAVNDESVKLTGVYKEVAIDSDSDGLFNKLNFIFEVEAKEDIEAAIQAELYAGAENITQRGDFFKLVKGKQNITLSFSGESIYDQKTDGPYNIKRVFITPIESGITTDSKEEAILTTKPYKYNQFGPIN